MDWALLYCTESPLELLSESLIKHYLAHARLC